jgi:hypothetical protein
VGLVWRAAPAGGNVLRAAKQALQLHGQCEELSLDFLDAAAVSEYLARRFVENAFRLS